MEQVRNKAVRCPFIVADKAALVVSEGLWLKLD